MFIIVGPDALCAAASSCIREKRHKAAMVQSPAIVNAVGAEQGFFWCSNESPNFWVNEKSRVIGLPK